MFSRQLICLGQVVVCCIGRLVVVVLTHTEVLAFSYVVACVPLSLLCFVLFAFYSPPESHFERHLERKSNFDLLKASRGEDEFAPVVMRVRQGLSYR